MWTTIKNLFKTVTTPNQKWEEMGERAVVSQHYRSDGSSSGWVDMASHPEVEASLLSQLAEEDNITTDRPDGMYRRESGRVWVIHTVTGVCKRQYRCLIVGKVGNEESLLRLWNRLCYSGNAHENVHENVKACGVSHKCKVTGF